jgi:paraquat-inducible protein A
MVDMFVGATLVALVQLKAFASVVPGPGAVFFGAVVVLTMLATHSFDPRLTWDALEEHRG